MANIVSATKGDGNVTEIRLERLHPFIIGQEGCNCGRVKRGQAKIAISGRLTGAKISTLL